MKESKIKIFFLLIISLIVVALLFSNIGQNFKINISSYENSLKYFRDLSNYAKKSRNYQNFINSTSSYLTKIVKSNRFEPLMGNSYIDSWDEKVPFTRFTSSLEVYNSNNSSIKKYIYGKDFLEDYRGIITNGSVKSKADYAESLAEIHKVLKEILLFDGYENTTSGAITLMDAKLKSLGASGIISPILTDKPIKESGFYEKDLVASKKGIAKFIVSREVFNELKNYAKKGCIIKIKSGADVEPISYKNIYGIFKGKSASFKPLVIGIFYDGPQKIKDNKFTLSRNSSVPPAIILDCMRVVNKQRLRRPDRTIIFAFFSGYSRDKLGLKHFLKTYPKGNLVVLDGLGLSSNLSVNSNKFPSDLSSMIYYYLDKYNFNITSKKKDANYADDILLASYGTMNSNQLANYPNFYLSYNSSQFVLSLIREECYNLNILSGNIRQFKSFGRFVRNNSVYFSISAILLLLLTLFLPKNKKQK